MQFCHSQNASGTVSGTIYIVEVHSQKVIATSNTSFDSHGDIACVYEVHWSRQLKDASAKCYPGIEDASPVVRDAFAHLQTAKDLHLERLNLGGDEYFVMKQEFFSIEPWQSPDGMSQEPIRMMGFWMQPVADLHGKLNRSVVVMSIAIALPLLVLLLAAVFAVVHFLQQRKWRLLYNDNRVAEETALAISELNFANVAWLSEIPYPSRIQMAFTKIVSHLEQLQAFIPTSLYAKNLCDADTVLVPLDHSPRESHSSVSHPQHHPFNLSRESSGHAPGSDHPRHSTSPKLSGRGRSHGSFRKLDLGLHLCMRKVAVLVVSLTVDTGSLPSADQAHKVTEILGCAISYIWDRVVECRGILEFGGHSSEFVAYWNTALDCRQPARAAAQAAWAIHVRLAALCKAEHGVRVAYHIGVTEGPALCGNVGNNNIRKFSAHGLCVHEARALSTLQCWQDSKPPVLLSASVAAEAKHVFTYVIVDCVRHVHPSAGPLLVARALEDVKMQEDEWMYQLAQFEDDDPHLTFNAAFTDWYHGIVPVRLEQFDGTERHVARLRELAREFPGGSHLIPATVH